LTAGAGDGIHVAAAATGTLLRATVANGSSGNGLGQCRFVAC
jgi:hypothetical protein